MTTVHAPVTAANIGQVSRLADVVVAATGTRNPAL